MRIATLLEFAPNALIANKAPSNSSSFICFSLSLSVQGPRVVTPLHAAPYPDNDASEKISMSGYRGKKRFAATISDVGYPPLEIQLGAGG